MSQSLSKAWYEGHGGLWLLAPLSWLYGLISALRRRLFAWGLLKTRRFPVPLIVVGNITVGGTGKTPLTLALIERLQQEGFRPGVVSRGYGGQTDYPARVGAYSTPAQVGDEPLLIALRSGVPVVVDPQRPRAVASLLQDSDCDLVLSDDGLQHYALGRDLEICVIDGQRGLGNGHLLPRGPLREPALRLGSVDLVVGNGGDAGLPGAYPMRLQAQPWQSLSADNIAPAPGSTVHAVAGIGNPERFFAMLRQQGYQVLPHAFPDHHAFVAADLQFADDLPLVMTEKDAVKCRALALRHAWYVPVSAELSPEFFDALLAKLRPLRVTRHAR